MAKKQNDMIEEREEMKSGVEEKGEKEEKKEEKKAPKVAITQEQQKELLEQALSEFDIAEESVKQHRITWGLWLMLYGDRRKREAKKKIGDRTLFTVFQTVFASLYEDKLSVQFSAREIGDKEQASVVTDLAKFDYNAMEKEKIDYEWTYDACFFSRGFVLLHEFDRKGTDFLPVPEVIDPMTLSWDPRAKSINGYGSRRRGQARFLYRKIYLTKGEVEGRPGYFNTECLKNAGEKSGESEPYTREDAQNIDQNKMKSLKGENKEHEIIQGFSIFKNKKVMFEFVITGEDKKNKQKKGSIIRFVELGSTKKRWQIAERVLNPRSHEFLGDSIPSLIAEVQKSRADLFNAIIDNVRAGTYRLFAFDSSKILASDLKYPPKGADKFIPVQGSPQNVVNEIQRNQVKQEVSYILDYLKGSAEQATATPEVQQGAMAEEKRTATELALISQGSNNRYSLMAKVFGWSEREFWSLWYTIYKDNFDHESGDKKVIRIKGAGGQSWRTLTKENFSMEEDPDIEIESLAVASAKRKEELAGLEALTKDIVELGAELDVLEYIRHKSYLIGMKKEVIERIFPKTIEEYQSEEINKLLSANKYKKGMVKMGENHQFFLNMAKQAAETDAKKAYIEARIEMMMKEKLNPELLQERTPEENPGEDKAGRQPAGAPMRVEGKYAPGVRPQNAQDTRPRGIPGLNS